jgi:Polysaccharide pyruvyl transferase
MWQNIWVGSCTSHDRPMPPPNSVRPPRMVTSSNFLLPREGCKTSRAVPKPRITFITTVQHNVGDDFVREGIIYLLERILGRCEINLIHKHVPVTARPEWDRYYTSGASRYFDALPKRFGLSGSRLLDMAPLNPASDKILTADLLVQSGAPMYWLTRLSNTATNEWMAPLIDRRWRRVANRVPLLNIAAGTCQPYGSDGSEFARSPRTLRAIRRFFDDCRLTTVRDTLSQRVLALVERDAPVLPCTSIFARRNLGLEPQPPQYVALNYMPAGGHYRFGQDIDAARWETTFVDVARNLMRNRRCILACHSGTELSAARRILPKAEIFHSREYRDYLEFYSKAAFGLVNRVHAGFAIASFGRPAVIVGTDTRAQMAGVIGLQDYFVGDVTAAQLRDDMLRFEREAGEHARSFESLREMAEQRYLSLLREALPGLAGG